jgi:hypothetical protein
VTPDWPRDPDTGRVVLGARVGRTTMAETVERADARLRHLQTLRYDLGTLLVAHLDRLASGAPVEPIAAELIHAVDTFAGRQEGHADAQL